jgi:MYXO-CTERM domain-containing protein
MIFYSQVIPEPASATLAATAVLALAALRTISRRRRVR